MSLCKLPEIKAFDGLSEFDFVPDDDTVKRWRPDVRAATEGDDDVISIYDVIGEDFWTGEGVTSKRIAAALRRIGNRDVTVNMNSPGGDFFEGIAIYNLLREHPAKVTVKVMGLAASAASVIAMAGDEVQISEVGFLMVHNAWAIAIGNRHDFRAAADTLEPFDDAMAGLYAARAKADKSDAVAWMDAETWFNGAKAIEAGLADNLLPSSQVTQGDRDQTKNLLAERRAEMAMKRGGISSSRERKRLVAQLKGGRDVGPDPATRDAGDEWSAALADLLTTVKP